jgi:hypothetical protein
MTRLAKIVATAGLKIKKLVVIPCSQPITI